MSQGRQIIERFVTSITLGTLAAATALVSSTLIDGARDNGVRIKDLWMKVNWNGKTAAQGPITYGLGVDIPNVTAVKTALENDPQGFADTADTQSAQIKMMHLGVIDTASTTSLDQTSRMMKVRFPWKNIGENSILQVWAFNRFTSALTTGGVIDFEFVMNNEWLKD